MPSRKKIECVPVTIHKKKMTHKKVLKVMADF